MPLTPTADLLAEARRDGRGLGAFNVITLEHAEGIAAGAEAAGLPAVLQISENAVAFHGDPVPLARAAAAVAESSTARLALHLDHVTDATLIDAAAGCPFTSMMFDASTQPFEDNVAATRAAVRRATALGWLCEGELGEVGGKAGAHLPGARTDPGQARAYVERTGVGALAVAVGSSHAMVERRARLDEALIAELRAAVDVPLVLHGSSGVPDLGLGAAVRRGIVKVNVGTALNVALTATVRRWLAAGPDLVDPRPYLAAGRAAVAAEVGRLLRVLDLQQASPTPA
jgi:fructose-bisphosphate aldolase, class II